MLSDALRWLAGFWRYGLTVAVVLGVAAVVASGWIWGWFLVGVGVGLGVGLLVAVLGTAYVVVKAGQWLARKMNWGAMERSRARRALVASRGWRALVAWGVIDMAPTVGGLALIGVLAWRVGDDLFGPLGWRAVLLWDLADWAWVALPALALAWLVGWALGLARVSRGG